MAIDLAKISKELKSKCVSYVTENLLEDFYDSAFGESFLKKYEEQDREWKEFFDQAYPIWVDVMDKYILFGKTQNDEKVTNVILRQARLSAEMIIVLSGWRDRAFWSVFEIKKFNKHWLAAFDLMAEKSYNLHSNNLEYSMQEMLNGRSEGDFLLTSVTPIGGRWFLSGGQQVIDKNRERDVFEKYIEKIFSIKSIYRNNPAKLENAFRLQKIQFDKFLKYFGANILTGSGQELEDKINAFYANQRGDQKDEDVKKVNFVNLPDEVKQEPNVSTVMHPRQGLHFFNDYETFRRIFSDLKKSNGWNELVTGYLEDDEIPAFVFAEMKEKYPDNFRIVMDDIVAGFTIKKGFDPVDDFEMMMDEFKPDWREEYPSTHPINERFRKYYYLDQKVGRNDPCPCGNGKKFKKCCGW